MLRILVEWFKSSTEKAELERKNFKSELLLIKTQLNPHFLFNTLNNIDSLIFENPASASTALNKLSEMMRYMVYDCKNDFVALQDEIIYIQNFLALQKLRLTNSEFIQFEKKGDFEKHKIAPMLFIPFIENAFKHSSLKNSSENKIIISLEITASELNFYCFNTITNHKEKDETNGIGLNIVKKRLEMIYPNEHSLLIESTLGAFSVKLALKL